MALFKSNRPKLGEILVKKGLATKADIDDALRIQKEVLETKNTHKEIGIILCEKGIINKEVLTGVLEEQKRFNEFILKGLIYSMFHSR